jgi:hypothetical protein
MSLVMDSQGVAAAMRELRSLHAREDVALASSVLARALDRLQACGVDPECRSGLRNHLLKLRDRIDALLGEEGK